MTISPIQHGDPVIHIYVSLFFLFFCFLWLHPQHMEVPRLRVKSELQLPAYATTTARPYLSCVCNLHRSHSSRQCRILNPLSEARGWTHNLKVPSQIHFWCTMTGTPITFFDCTSKQFFPDNKLLLVICCSFRRLLFCFDVRFCFFLFFLLF